MIIKKKFLFALAVIFNYSISFSQKFEKVYLDKEDSTKNYYSIIQPTSKQISACLFLLPGFGENAENVLIQSEIPKKAREKGILTIIPCLQEGTLSFGIDSLNQQTLLSIYEDVMSKNKLGGKPIFIGGFSIGGTISIKFAEENPGKINALFAIDPPLDFERFYNKCLRDVRLSINTDPNQESLHMIDLLLKKMGGTPETHLFKYHEISPYSYADTTQKAIKKIINLPIRIYCEPDINWWLEERGLDINGINLVDCSAMINELKKLGNKNCELIISTSKGFRKPNNSRHPHSWSIADEQELINWLLGE